MYCFVLLSFRAEEYNCMNLMIVGDFNIGKTSLMKHVLKRGKQGLSNFMVNPKTTIDEINALPIIMSSQQQL